MTTVQQTTTAADALAAAHTYAARGAALTKVYGQGDTQVVALDVVDVDFRRVEFIAIMGRSGSVKSTLMLFIAGLVRVTSGRVLM